jgi:parallel beta-helix repeat protein
VTNNSISNALRTGDDTGYFGVADFCTSNLQISPNTIGHTNTAISVTKASAICGAYGSEGNSVTNNQVFDSSVVGIQVCGSDDTVQSNSLDASVVAAIALNLFDGQFIEGRQSNHNVVSENSINGACAAVLVAGEALDNKLDENDIFNAQFLKLSGSSCPR